jgi:hypothetical protein
MAIGRSYAKEIKRPVNPQKIRARYLTWPVCFVGAGNEIRTRDFNLGKVALYH